MEIAKTVGAQHQREKSEKMNSHGVNGKNILRLATSFMSGNFLTRSQTIQFLPFLFFLSLMAMIYIANGFYAERKIRKIIGLTSEIKELHSEYIISKSQLMLISKQSEVAKNAAAMGIMEADSPPKKITIIPGSFIHGRK